MRSSVSAAALLLAACSGAGGNGGRPRIGDGGYDAIGFSSWYGAAFAGRPTASGERFDPGMMTAAHRTLPFGTLVEVTAVDSGRTVLVRINDRGPGRRDRLIDRSHGAARALGVERRPSRVRVRSLRPGRDGRAPPAYGR